MDMFVFRLPDVGEGVAEAEITDWHVKVGDAIVEDDPLVDVMTDKATVEMTSPVSGIVSRTLGDIGDVLAVGAPLVEIDRGGNGAAADKSDEGRSSLKADNEGESIEFPDQRVSGRDSNTQVTSLQEQYKESLPGAKPDTHPVAPTPMQPAVPSGASVPFAYQPRSLAPLAAPATRRRAFELGVPLQFVPGTGPGERITEEDLDRFIASGRNIGADYSPATSSCVRREGVHEEKIIGMRRKIAERMQVAATRIPHITYVEEVDLTELEGLRKELNAEHADCGTKLTLLPFFIRAFSRLQPDFEHLNAHYDDEAGILRKFDGLHIGVATQTSAGLMVPVIRHAEALDIWACAREIKRVSSAARAGKASAQELTGSTITLSSLGVLGGIAATPIINAPEVAIIAPNKLVRRPVVRDEAIEIRSMMNISGSFDHRIVDGHDAARFIQAMKGLLEHPAKLFVERP